MARVSKFTDEQKLQIALDLPAGTLSVAEICRRYDISATYAYKLQDRVLDILRAGIGRPAGRRERPVRDAPVWRDRVRRLADQPRHRTFGYRRIWALLRREGLQINAKTVRRLMKDLGLSRPCSKRFVEFLAAHGIRGQYTGYNAPDDNAYVERVIHTIKEEEIRPNLWDMLSEARAAMEAYVTCYNEERIRSALDYRTPREVAGAFITPAAA